MKYTVYVTAVTSIDIEAKNEEEAINKALEQIDIGDLEVEDYEVEECDDE